MASCQKFISGNLVSEKRWQREKEYVASCREKWIYGDLKQNLNVRILSFQLKSDHQQWHPNFFIGSSTEGDTIGLIDYDFDGRVAIGDTIHFLPGKSRNDTNDGFYTIGHYPLFTVSHRRKNNSILCSVKHVYYAEMRIIGE